MPRQIPSTGRDLASAARSERDLDVVPVGIDVHELGPVSLAVERGSDITPTRQHERVGHLDHLHRRLDVAAVAGRHEQRQRADRGDGIDVAPVDRVAIHRGATDRERDRAGPSTQNISKYLARSQSVTCAWYSSHSARFMLV